MKIQLLLILVMLTNLKLLASSRLGSSIRTIAVQGSLLGLLPLFIEPDPFQFRFIFLALCTILIKGIVFPILLFKALNAAEVSREVQPYVGYISSLLFGVVSLIIAFWLGNLLSLKNLPDSSLIVPVSFFGIFSGLFLIISRKRAINQVLGFLVLENGVFAFGAGVIGVTSLLVEIGILLDIFVALFVMGITVFHISQECDHIDTDKLSTLKD
jgi:hydrogenase-4 component E